MDRYKYAVAAVFVIGLFMDILDATVVNVALPTLGREFDAGASDLEWVVTGYLLSLAVWVPASGWLGDRFGTKKVFLAAMTVFTAGSVLCAQAGSIEELVAFRILQGVGGGMMTPVGMAMLFRAYGPQERASASAIIAVPALVAPVLGPLLGGWLTDGPGWRWIFYINLPAGVLGLLAAYLLLREHREEQVGRLDVTGFVLAGAGLAAVLFGLGRAPQDGWGSLVVVASGLAGLTSLAAMAVIELRKREPMLDLRLLSDRMFRSANLAFFMQLAGLLGLLFLLPLFLQQVRGLSATEVGLTVLAQGVAMGICLPLAGRLYGRLGPRRMMMSGLAVVAATSACFVFVDLETSLWWIRAILFVRGAGVALAGVAVQAAAFANIEPRSMGRASSLFRTNTQVASSLGVAILATVLSTRLSTHLADAGTAHVNQAQLAAFHEAFLAAALLGVIGFGFSFMVRDADAAASLQSPAMQREPVREAAS